jgi:hypothetical protein
VIKAAEQANRRLSALVDEKITGAATRAALISDCSFPLPVGPFEESHEFELPAPFRHPARPRLRRYTGSYEKGGGAKPHKCGICRRSGHNARNTQFHTPAQIDDYRVRRMITTIEEDQADIDDDENPPDSSSSSLSDS